MKLFILFISLFSFTCQKESTNKTVRVDFTNYGSLNAIVTFEGEQGQGTYQAVSNGAIVTLQIPCNGTYTITLELSVQNPHACTVFLNGILSMPLQTGLASAFENEIETDYGFSINCR